MSDRMRAYMEDRDTPTPLAYGQPRHVPVASGIYQYPTSNYSTSSYPTPNQAAGTDCVPRSRGNVSYGSESTSTEYNPHHRGSFSSVGSSNAFTTMTAPSLNGDLPLHILAAQTHVLPMNRISYPYELVCEFGFANCPISFHADDYEDWILHSFSHFGAAGPPPKSICTICDDYYFDRSSWRERMLHIRDHFVHGATAMSKPILRPDFFVIRYIQEIGMVSPQDYEVAMQYTERPQPKGSLKLVPFGYQTKEMLLKSERDSRIPVDLERERRQMDRESKKGKFKDTKDEKHTRRYKR